MFSTLVQLLFMMIPIFLLEQDKLSLSIFFVKINKCVMDLIVVDTEKDDISANKHVLLIKPSMMMLVILH
jgi:hypothetical protein